MTATVQPDLHMVLTVFPDRTAKSIAQEKCWCRSRVLMEASKYLEVDTKYEIRLEEKERRGIYPDRPDVYEWHITLHLVELT